jgi:hypothetical protein
MRVLIIGIRQSKIQTCPEFDRRIEIQNGEGFGYCFGAAMTGAFPNWL